MYVAHDTCQCIAMSVPLRLMSAHGVPITEVTTGCLALCCANCYGRLELLILPLGVTLQSCRDPWRPSQRYLLLPCQTGVSACGCAAAWQILLPSHWHSQVPAQ